MLMVCRFFSSYHRGAEGWEYNMGNFASLAHPLVDEVELTIEYPDETGNITFSVSSRPYHSMACTHSIIPVALSFALRLKL